jgi:hypothetical protein
MKSTATPGFTAYAADLARIAGRFTLISKSDESTVVGLFGSARYEDLNDTQLRHIAHFYGMEPDPHEYLTSYPVERNESSYTGFIRFKKKGETK